VVRQRTDIPSPLPAEARRDGNPRRPRIRPAWGLPALGKGLVTLGLAISLAACGGGAATQVGNVLATQAPTATATSAAPTATATVAATPATVPSPTSAPAATQPSTPTATATRTAAVSPTRPTSTATRPASSPTTAPAGGVIRDENGVCQLTLPAGYTMDSGGDGFDATDENGFGVLAGATGRSDSAEALAQSVYINFTSVMEDVQQGKVTNTPDSSRIDFTAALADNPGQGTVYVKKFGTSVCAMSVFTYDEAQVPHATAMATLIATLKGNK
jgi:hypothetical protein